MILEFLDEGSVDIRSQRAGLDYVFPKGIADAIRIEKSGCLFRFEMKATESKTFLKKKEIDEHNHVFKNKKDCYEGIQ